MERVASRRANASHAAVKRLSHTDQFTTTDDNDNGDGDDDDDDDKTVRCSEAGRALHARVADLHSRRESTFSDSSDAYIEVAATAVSSQATQRRRRQQQQLRLGPGNTELAL